MKKYVELSLDNKILRGYHHMGYGDTLLVMFHGFTGHKTETGYLFRKLSDALSSNNIDSIRFDYLGSGESDGLFSDMTLDSLLEQAEVILKYAKAHKYKEINLLGFSMGGALTMNLLSNSHKTVLIAPAIDFDIKFRDMNLLDNGNYDLNGWELNKNLFKSFKRDYYGMAKKHKNPVLIIQGSMDQAVNKDSSIKLHEHFDNSELLLIDQGTHVFHNRKHYMMIEEAILRFLQ